MPFNSSRFTRDITHFTPITLLNHDSRKYNTLYQPLLYLQTTFNSDACKESVRAFDTCNYLVYSNRINTVHTCNLDKFLLRNVACLRREGDLFLVARRGVIDSFLVKKKNATHEMLFRILKFSCTLSNGWIQFIFEHPLFSDFVGDGRKGTKGVTFHLFLLVAYYYHCYALKNKAISAFKRKPCLSEHPR